MIRTPKGKRLVAVASTLLPDGSYRHRPTFAVDRDSPPDPLPEPAIEAPRIGRGVLSSHPQGNLL